MIKKYLNNFVVSSLLAAFVIMASGFCIMGPNGNSFLSINDASAAAISQAAMPEYGGCDNNDQSEPMDHVNGPKPISDQGKAFMPCCVNESHSGVPSLSQSTIIASDAPAIIIAQEKTSITAAIETACHALIESPPNLSAVLTTNLRL